MEVFLPFIPSLISVPLIILGWWVIFKNAQKIATRTETKGILDSALASLKELTDLSIAFWVTRAKSGSASEFDVTTSHIFTKLALSLQLLEQRGVAYNLDKLNNLMILCTLDCERIENMSADDLRAKCNDLAAESTAIYEDLMSNFHSTYKPTGVKKKK